VPIISLVIFLGRRNSFASSSQQRYKRGFTGAALQPGRHEQTRQTNQKFSYFCIKTIQNQKLQLDAQRPALNASVR